MSPARHTQRATAVTAALMVCALISGCTTAGSEQTGSKGYVSGDGTITLVDPDEREQAPTLKGEALGGGTIDTADFAGKTLMLNVWGSWCGDCRGEARDLAAAARKLPQAQFLGINTRDQDAGAEAFVRRFDIPYPSLVDEDSQLLLPFYEIVNANAIPSTIVVDSAGRVAAVISGPTTTSTLVGLVQDVEQDA